MSVLNLLIDNVLKQPLAYVFFDNLRPKDVFDQVMLPIIETAKDCIFWQINIEFVN